MKFTYANRQDLDEQYIHDSEFEGYHYDYDNREIVFSCVDGFGEKRIHLAFHGVIFVEMQACAFWMPWANSICHMWHEENTPQMDRLIDLVNSDREYYDKNYLTEGIDYIQIRIQILSGDTLLIICEDLEWTEEKLNN